MISQRPRAGLGQEESRCPADTTRISAPRSTSPLGSARSSSTWCAGRRGRPSPGNCTCPGAPSTAKCGTWPECSGPPPGRRSAPSPTARASSAGSISSPMPPLATGRGTRSSTGRGGERPPPARRASRPGRRSARCAIRRRPPPLGNHLEGKDTMALLLRTKTRVLAAMRKEARRRGLSVTKYMGAADPRELIALIKEVDRTVYPAEIVPGLPDIPPVDVTRWGLPPECALTTDLSRSVPMVGAPVAAARSGDWPPAAHLLSRSHGDWAMRAVAVHALGEAAADDGTWLRSWRAAVGEDRHLAVVDAQGLLWLAWKLRGNRPETTPERQGAFVQTLLRSEAAARRAIELAPEDPTPWCTLVT